MKTRDRIITLRKRLGLSRKELAEKLDCTYTTIFYWENAIRKPSFKQCFKLVKMARFAGLKEITLDWLRPDL